MIAGFIFGIKIFTENNSRYLFQYLNITENDSRYLFRYLNITENNSRYLFRYLNITENDSRFFSVSNIYRCVWYAPFLKTEYSVKKKYR